MTWTTGDKLHPDDQQRVLASFTYRMTHENASLRPHVADYMRSNGYTLPLIWDRDWLAQTHFAVRKNGRLDRRARYCLGGITL